MTDGFPDLEQLLDGVWQRRRSELVGRVVLLRAHVERSEQDVDAWVALGAEAHRLTGALGSLGFDELAHEARALESAVGESPAGPRDVAGLRSAVERMHDALCAAQSRPRS